MESRADLNTGSLTGMEAGAVDAPVPPADPDSTCTGGLLLSLSCSVPATQKYGVSQDLPAEKDDVH